jgi:uncharacterized DUF497 family protein
LSIQFAGFDWDEGNIGKCLKHGASRAEIEQLFLGAVMLLLPDVLHSDDEERFIAVGRTLKGRGLFVAFTERVGPHGILIRPISARYMHKKEIDKYEQESSALPQR